jgi:DNA polymerase-3 subunit alpha
MVGAEKKRYELTPEIQEMDFELLTISNSGYPGYFLIVQDFIAKAREMDVSVGPGSAGQQNYNIDPIKYDLLLSVS